MEVTHHRAEGTALVGYSVAKAPALANPLDPNSATGNTSFILSEIYETESGVAEHLRLSEAWEDFPALLHWMEQCTTDGLPYAPIINSLW